MTGPPKIVSAQRWRKSTMRSRSCWNGSIWIVESRARSAPLWARLAAENRPFLECCSVPGNVHRAAEILNSMDNPDARKSRHRIGASSFQRYSVFSTFECRGKSDPCGSEFEQARWSQAACLAPTRKKTIERYRRNCSQRIGLGPAANRFAIPHSFQAACSKATGDRAGADQSGRSILLLDEPFGALDPGIRARHASIASDRALVAT